MRLVLGQAAGYTALGIVLGVIGAFATRRLVATQLFGVGPSDLATLCGAALVLACVAVAGAFVPMRRAASADPMDALRAQ
jgi:ABC-type antimicrobial peptide transport system permease subunit